MKYKLETYLVDSKDGKKDIIIKLPDKLQMLPVSIFLGAKLRHHNKDEILEVIDRVLENESNIMEFYSTDIIDMEIGKKFTRVIFEYPETPRDRACRIETIELKNVILSCLEERKKFYESYTPPEYIPPPDLDLIEDPNVFKSGEERAAYLDELREIRGEMNRTENADPERYKVLCNELRQKEYAFGLKLPYKAMGTCPYCGNISYRRFDRWGIDGLIYSIHDQAPEKYGDCSHFYRITAAVNYGDKLYNKVNPSTIYYFSSKLMPGADMPYVYEDELEQEGKIAVIGSLEMECGYTAYPICYYSDPPQFVGKFPPSYHYHFFKHKYPDGRSDAWDGEPWGVDYSLEDWLEKGKLRWCEPGSGNKALSKKDPVECPYIYLKGCKLFVEFLSPAMRPPDGGRSSWPRRYMD